MTKKILIGIATYNECDNIKNLVEQIINIGENNIDILIVDDNSPDGTIEEIKKLQKKINNIFLVVRMVKLGLGSAHKRIIHFAKINKYDGLLTMDADFSHTPNLIKEFIKENIGLSNVKLKYYAYTNISPENIVMVAKKMLGK